MIVHGGAWPIPDRLVDVNIAGVEEAVRQGWETLEGGGSALDAVVAAVNSLEDNPVFDAGIGSVLTEDGTVEMDALIMDGASLEAGAVAGLRDIRYPIRLARLVMEETPHVMMIGEGAHRLAERHGLEKISQDELVTDEARQDLAGWLKKKEYGAVFGHETVGAVALDRAGNLAAATSTGGVTGKLVGRIGDVPIVGSGGYADNRVGGVSSTGHGESIMKVNLARLVLSNMEKGMTPKEAAEAALGCMDGRVHGQGGVIVIGRDGEVGFSHTTSRMAWAYIKGGDLRSGVHA
ncbi:isoaspartyl peptidase/L-asparaginase [Candidatus Bathyarchaeota archaeon]|nr:isoaspartyl peptidase/L-asparaginase [Candidatus Bathyarchaeota archaeon]